MILKTGLRVREGQWKCHHSIQYGSISCQKCRDLENRVRGLSKPAVGTGWRWVHWKCHHSI